MAGSSLRQRPVQARQPRHALQLRLAPARSRRDPHATNRDLRRTFKTLAGKAGIPKEIRDRLQNHALQDVSSKHYDRWNYMVEKRAGMAKWDKFVRAMLAKKRLKAAA
jgi:hypothetical protein